MDKQTNQTKAYIFAVTSVFFWATISTAFKLALKELDFIQLQFISIVIALLIATVYLIYNKKFKEAFRINKKQFFTSALAAFINPFAYYLILLKAYSLLPAQIAQPLNYTWPIVLVLLSALFLKQKLKLRSIIALLISLLGVFIISSQGQPISLKINEPLGVFLALISSVFWAMFWIINLNDKREDIIKLFWNFLLALIYEIPVIFIFSSFDFHFNKSFFAAIYSGFFEMGITFIIWMKALQNAERTDKVSNLIFLSPVMALFFIHFILGEKLYYTTYIGFGLILSSIYYINFKRKKKNVTIE